MPAKLRWYHHLEPATGFVPCDGELHRVTWRRGKFVLEDHDLGAERALLALGGEPCACLRALRLWADQFGMPPEFFGRMQTWLGADAVLAPKELQLPREVGMTLSWERAWRRAALLDKHGRLLEEQLRAKAVGPLRQHLTVERQRFGCRVVRSVNVRLLPRGSAAGVTGSMDKVSVSATVSLASAWIVDVWARGIAVVEGAYVLEVTDEGATSGEATVRAVRWVSRQPGVAIAEAAPARVRRDGEAWTLTWLTGNDEP